MNLKNTNNMKINIKLKLLLLSIMICITNNYIFPQSNIEKKIENLGMIDIQKEDPTLVIDLRYATTNNFTKGILYDSLKTAYLHPLAAKKLIKAHTILKEKYPNYRFHIFDVARPLSVQRKMFEVVKNTPYQAYVANPSRTGLHNYGMAVDLSIIDIETGKELPMGTAFDFFGSLAGINQEDTFLANGQLTQEEYKNRRILRDAMRKAGFLTIRGEWWHFNAVSLKEAKENYKVLE